MTEAPAPERSAERSGSRCASTDHDDEEGPTPAAAFQQLGNETRLDVVRRLSADGPCSFSDLFAASDSDSSAGFAYHLRQLDQFVRQRDDERWELTAAGREAARTVQAGDFTADVDHEEVALDETCPLCREATLELSVSGGVTEVTCTGCGESVVRLSFPPGGLRREEDGLPGALDTYHRNRISTFADGVCPDCGGHVETTPQPVPPADEGTDETPQVAQFTCECTRCTASVDCPATIAVLDHPAVVSFYDDHDRDVTEQPVWNVGSEWRERVVSTDPWCLLVSTRLDDELLELYVGDDGTAHAHRRRDCSERSGAREVTDVTESSELGDDAAA